MVALNDATLWDLMGQSVPKPRIRLELQIDLVTFHVSSKSVYNPPCAKCEAAPSQLRMSGRMSSSQRLHSWHVSEACISVDKATERPLASVGPWCDLFHWLRYRKVVQDILFATFVLILIQIAEVYMCGSCHVMPTLPHKY